MIKWRILELLDSEEFFFPKTFVDFKAEALGIIGKALLYGKELAESEKGR